MFEKLLKNLPYNPSLVHQMKFYARRLHSEESIRRTGLVFIVLAFLVQFFAVASPPQPTLANSVNDLINGGISSKSEAVSACKQNVRHYKEILNYYGISCSAIADATTVSLRSTDHDKRLYSMGWNPQGPENKSTGKPTGETRVDIPGINDPLYWRFLWSWDAGAYSTYKALKLHNNDGKTFWILYNCGNLVSVGVPPHDTPPPPPPTPPQVLSCSNLAMDVADYAKVQVDSTVSVRGQAAGKNIEAGQTVNMVYQYVNSSTGKVVSSQTSKGVKFKNTTANDPTSHSFTNKEVGKYEIRLIVKYDSGKVARGSATGACLKHLTVQKPCAKAPSSIEREACLTYHKTATNVTQNLTDANNTTAQPGDIIVYKLFVKNTGRVTVEKFVMQENLSDVLDYADITNLDGGKMNPVTKVVVWKAKDIPAGQTISHRITVKVKDSIPQTPASTSDPFHFDCLMTNVYGNTVSIKVPCATITTVANTTGTLPKTGPGTSLMIAGAIVMAAGYFFARARLLATETVLAIHQSSTHGGL